MAATSWSDELTVITAAEMCELSYQNFTVHSVLPNGSLLPSSRFALELRCSMITLTRVGDCRLENYKAMLCSPINSLIALSSISI